MLSVLAVGEVKRGTRHAEGRADAASELLSLGAMEAPDAKQPLAELVRDGVIDLLRSEVPP